MKPLTLATALLLATVSFPSWAQSPADHELHHPDQKEAQPTPSPSQSGMMGGAQGMMGDGMTKMMGVMPMADMMRMMTGMMRQSDDDLGGMATIDHVEGRISFLRTELKITDAQTSAWNALADALRANAKTLGEVRASMMPQQGTTPRTLVDRLTLQEKWLSARLEGTRAIKSALTNLIASFSDDQKKAADELLAPHMGMMGMMAAIRSGQMGPGQMQPGMMKPGQ